MIVFRNSGVIDPTSITTFGVSSKERPGAIGFFGTGLKYAIAILLREGCKITINAGGQCLEFSTERARVRVDEFTFITMNGERLGFTTELGKTWELWMAFRELYCNCKDEDGTVMEWNPGDPRVDFTNDETVITVEGEAFRDVWAKRGDIILDKQPIYRNAAVNICGGTSEWVYYRGVRVAKLMNPSRFTYDIQRKIDLTEDRTIKSNWDMESAIKRGLLECDQTAIISQAVLAPKGTFEQGLEYTGVMPSQAFLDVVRGHMRTYNPACNRSAIEACRIWLMEQIIDEDQAALSPLDEARLEKAVKFCEQIGFPVRDYPIKVLEFLGDEVLGRAHEGTILLSRRVFLMGTKMVAGTLIEEFIHLRHRCHDETRVMQNILMDTICSLGEQITGEPL